LKRRVAAAVEPGAVVVGGNRAAVRHGEDAELAPLHLVLRLAGRLVLLEQLDDLEISRGRVPVVRDAVVVTELPYQVNKARLIEKIAELVHEKRLDGISEIRDESNREGMRIVIELKRDAIPQVILNKLYKLTPMQSSFGIISIAIVDGQPKLLNLKQMLEAFVEFRREVVRRRTEFDLRKAQARAHVLEGLNKAIDALDYIIPLIRNSRSVDEARLWLTAQTSTMSEVKTWKGVPSDVQLKTYLTRLQKTMDQLSFSELQAQAILDLQLRRLSALERPDSTCHQPAFDCEAICTVGRFRSSGCVEPLPLASTSRRRQN